MEVITIILFEWKSVEELSMTALRLLYHKLRAGHAAAAQQKNIAKAILKCYNKKNSNLRRIAEIAGFDWIGGRYGTLFS